MTQRLKGLLVTFDRDVREDDAQAIVNAIRMLKCVIGVDPVPAGIDDHMARVRVRFELWDRLRALLLEGVSP